MKRIIIKVSVVMIGVLTVPVIANQKTRMVTSGHDARIGMLKDFFQYWDSPGDRYAEAFLDAADSYDLDWRLLPSICLVESGCGKVYKNNNIFGWDSCDTGFPTVESGIWTVASRLAKSPLYEGKTLDGVLWTYNPRQRYRRVVRRLMSSIDPVSKAPDPTDLAKVPGQIAD